MAVEKELQEMGVKAKGYQSDASDFGAAEKLVDAIVADFGDLNVVVNNAGITRDNLLMRMKEEEWDDIMSTNLKSVYRLSKSVMRTMMKARSGRIINITSVVGVTGNAGQTNYSASKAGRRSCIPFNKHHRPP